MFKDFYIIRQRIINLMNIHSLCVSESIVLNPQQSNVNQSASDTQSLSLKKSSEKASTNDIFLTHKLKTERSTHSIQNVNTIQKRSIIQPKITIITRNVQPLDQLDKEQHLYAIKKAKEKQKTQNSKKRYFEHKLDQISYNLKSAYLKKYKLSKSVRLKVQNEGLSSLYKQDHKKEHKKESLQTQKGSYSLPLPVQKRKHQPFSTSINLQTIYHDKTNKIAPQNIQKYHNNFQLLKCAFQKNAQQKMNRVFQRQRQLEEERNLINEEIVAKLKRKAHSMRARKIQQSSYKLQSSQLRNQNKVQKISLPKLSGHFIVSFSEANVNLHQNKIESPNKTNILKGQRQKILNYKNIHMNKKRLVTIV